MDPAELVSLEQLSTHRSSVISLQCLSLEEEPALSLAISDLLELSDTKENPSQTYYRSHANRAKIKKHYFTGRRWSVIEN